MIAGHSSSDLEVAVKEEREEEEEENEENEENEEKSMKKVTFSA